MIAHRRELVAQIRHTLGLYLTDSEMRHIRPTSIQWLTIHYKELEEQPGLIVIDEAHHAIAKTYALVLDSYPYAKKLGVTATPYRLSGAGFKDMFDVLLTSWDIKTFIHKGFLCPFDYYCISRSSVEMFKVDGLKKRGADGDYQPKELDENFNQNEIISRLYDAYQKYAPGKRGFIYAINIKHAENIAAYFRGHGVNAVAVSSKTTDDKRAEHIDNFKKGNLTILCSVDLFSEGFDSPDAEFVQLARPTLSLAKYLQMVGRGLRTAKGKKTCIILDNVGLKDKFGLPSRERNWQAYFDGDWRKRRGKKDVDEDNLSLVERVTGDAIGPEDIDQMTLETSYEVVKAEEKFFKQFKVVTSENGMQGIGMIDGSPLIKCVYDHVAINEDGIAALKLDAVTKWYDLRNDVVYDKLPDVGYVGRIPIAYVDEKFYPRLKSQWITNKSYISVKTMRMQYGNGLDWSNRFINWEGKPKVYKVVDFFPSGVRILRDDDNKRYVQRNPKGKLVSMSFIKDLDKWIESRNKEYEEFVRKAKSFPVVYADPDIEELRKNNKRVWKDEFGIITVVQENGKQYWINTISKRRFDTRPVCRDRGHAKLLYIGDFVFVRNLASRPLPYQDWQITSYGMDIQINANY